MRSAFLVGLLLIGVPVAADELDAAAHMFEKTTAPRLPDVFGKLRLGMRESRARAVEPRLVAPPQSGDPIFLPLDEGVSVRRGYPDGDRMCELAVRFDAPTTTATLTTLWGAPVALDKALLWFNPKTKLKAKLQDGVLSFSTYMPAADLFGARSALLGKSVAALEALYGKVDADDQKYGLGRHMSSGPGLEWEAGPTSVYLLQIKNRRVIGYYMSARAIEHAWDREILAAARKVYGAEKDFHARDPDATESEETWTFEDKRTRLSIKASTRGERITFVELRGALK